MKPIDLNVEELSLSCNRICCVLLYLMTFQTSAVFGDQCFYCYGFGILNLIYELEFMWTYL